MRFARSAPQKPGVCLAISAKLTSSAKGLSLEWTFRISSLLFKSGASKTTLLSNLPGLSKAGSNTSGLFVAAIKITLVSCSKPSISTKIWFKVCSRSSWDPPSPAPLWRPTASISSIKIMQGAFFLALANKSLTLDAPTPTNISTNSEPEIEKNGTPASPATALASKVLPVPGRPTSRTPFGILAPRSVNFFGFFRKSTTSVSSCFASWTPATSAKVTFFLSGPKSLARLFPNIMAWLLDPWACFNMV